MRVELVEINGSKITCPDTSQRCKCTGIGYVLWLLQFTQVLTETEIILVVTTASYLTTQSVRELPPPTPREAYLPQRLRRVHKRETSRLS